MENKEFSEMPEGISTGDVSNCDESISPEIVEVVTDDADKDAVEVVGDDSSDDADMFPRHVVEKLRKENAAYRVKAKQVDELQQRLHVALVAADGRLADPADLPFDVEHLDDADKLAAAIGALVDLKPGLRSRIARGDVGAGARGESVKPATDLASIIRGMM